MKSVQLIVIFLLCTTYGTHGTTIRVGHKPGFGGTEVIAESSRYSAMNSFGRMEIMKPLKSSLQKATVAMCHKSRLCNHEMLNEPPFVNLLGPYQYHESHRSPLAFLNDLNPKYLLGVALQDILGGVKEAESDILLAPVKSLVDGFTGIFG